MQSWSTPADSFDPFRLWLHRPLLDLGPAPSAPTLLVHAVELDYGSMVEPEPRPRIQISINPSFREALAAAVGCPRYGVARCADLPEADRTPRWSTLCELVACWAGLPAARQVRVCWTLAKLGLYDDILDLIPSVPVARIAADEEGAALAYLRAWARSKKWLDNEDVDFAPGEFAEVALNAPPGMTRIDAAYEMVRQNAKHTGDAAACVRWQETHRAAIDDAGLDEHTRALMLSRYFRVGAFIPQFHGDASAVGAEMERAVELARTAPREGADQAVAADEMLCAALESRVKEALWRTDLPMALDHADQYVAITPTSARGHMHRAEVLFRARDWAGCRASCLEAARLAPPHADESSFLLAQCYEREGAPDEAVSAYLATLRADPLAISAVERLAELAQAHNRPALLDWVNGYAAHLRRHEPAESWPAPYRDLPAPAPTS